MRTREEVTKIYQLNSEGVSAKDIGKKLGIHYSTVKGIIERGKPIDSYSPTVEQIKDAVASSVSLREALNRLGVVAAGGNYETLRKAVRSHSIDTSHMLGQKWRSGRTSGPKRPLHDYLSNKSPIPSHNLKKRLISEGVLQHKCSLCGITEWMGKPSPIELDHIDGNNKNNSLDNLRLLCPNCHAQTDTYRGKNKGNDAYRLG